MAGEHTHKTIDLDLGKLDKLLMQMVDATEKQLSQAMESLITQNQILASQTVHKDKEVNELQHQVDELSLRVLALRQPVAIDLRRVVAAGKMAVDLERIADYAGNIASDSIRLELRDQDITHYFELHRNMADIALEMLEQIRGAYQNNDADEAQNIWRRDREIDQLYGKLMSRIQNDCAGNPECEPDSLILLQVGRALERIGDHITNLAEQIYFTATGKTMKKP